MKFAALVASLVVFAILVGPSESSVDDLVDGIPNEITDVLKNFIDDIGYLNYSKTHTYYGTINLNITPAVHPEFDAESIKTEKYGNSVVQVSFDVTLPDLALTGEVGYHPVNSRYNYNGTFTSIAVSEATFKVNVTYAFTTKALIPTSKLTAYPEEYITQYDWIEKPADFGYVQEKVELILKDDLMQDINEKFIDILHEKKLEIIDSLDSLYKHSPTEQPPTTTPTPTPTPDGE